VLVKHRKSFSFIDCLSVGVDRMQRNFDAMRKQVETWQMSELTDVTANRMGRYEESIAAAKEAIRIDPHLVIAYENLMQLCP
jgi:tetratricopeptide (TPR) repeat protein